MVEVRARLVAALVTVTDAFGDDSTRLVLYRAADPSEMVCPCALMLPQAISNTVANVPLTSKGVGMRNRLVLCITSCLSEDFGVERASGLFLTCSGHARDEPSSTELRTLSGAQSGLGLPRLLRRRLSKSLFSCPFGKDRCAVPAGRVDGSQTIKSTSHATRGSARSACDQALLLRLVVAIQGRANVRATRRAGACSVNARSVIRFAHSAFNQIPGGGNFASPR